jgi:hypothetical protein
LEIKNLELWFGRKDYRNSVQGPGVSYGSSRTYLRVLSRWRINEWARSSIVQSKNKWLCIYRHWIMRCLLKSSEGWKDRIGVYLKEVSQVAIISNKLFLCESLEAWAWDLLLVLAGSKQVAWGAFPVICYNSSNLVFHVV